MWHSLSEFCQRLLEASAPNPGPLRCPKCGEPITYRIVAGPDMTGIRQPQIVNGMCTDCAWMQGADDERP